MRRKPLVVRGSAIIISFTHVLIVSSLFFPYFLFQKGAIIGWQWFLPLPLRLDLSSLGISGRLALALVLPPLASLVVFYSPTRLLGLLGVWISLPLTLFSCYLFASTAMEYQGNLIGISPAVWFPPVGFALSFLTCLALALSLPLLRAHVSARRAMSRAGHLETLRQEAGERVSPSDQGEFPAEAPPRRRLQLSLVFLGLLCHLLIGLSLLLPFTDLYNGMEGDLRLRTTGWQLLGNDLQFRGILAVIALLLLAALVLLPLIYLACLLSFLLKSKQRDRLLFTSAYLGYLLNMTGFSLSLGMLVFSLFYGGDLYDYVLTDAAFVLPPAGFPFSLFCSAVLLYSRFWPRRARERRS